MKTCATHGVNNCPPLCTNSIEIAGTAGDGAGADAKSDKSGTAGVVIEDLKAQQQVRETGLAQQDVGNARRDIARVRAEMKSLRELFGDVELQLDQADQLLAKYDPRTVDHE